LNLFRPAVLAALLLLAPAAGFARGGPPPAWTRYVNARFGYSIEYPARTFVPERAPDNGDGRRFRAIRGGARFMVWAGHNVLKQSPKQFVAESASACRQGRAHYAQTGKGVAVVSCERRGEIFYARRLFAKGMITGFQMTYPASERGRWDMALSRMAESLKPARKR
jgi:hypothetical protein